MCHIIGWGIWLWGVREMHPLWGCLRHREQHRQQWPRGCPQVSLCPHIRGPGCLPWTDAKRREPVRPCGFINTCPVGSGCGRTGDRCSRHPSGQRVSYGPGPTDLSMTTLTSVSFPEPHALSVAPTVLKWAVSFFSSRSCL